MPSIDYYPGFSKDKDEAFKREREEVKRKYYELRDERHYVYVPEDTATVAGFFFCPDCGVPDAKIRTIFLDCTCCGSDATQWRK